MSKVNILGVMVDKYSIQEAADKIVEYIKNGERQKCVFTPNSEIIMMGYKDESFCKVLNEADILTADGIGVVYASKIVGNPIKSRAAGYDTALEVMNTIAKFGKSVYLFGSKPGVADTAAEKIKQMYPGIVIAGTSDGYFDLEKEKQIIENINSCKPDLLLVCLGAPKQELWINAHKNELDFGVCMGVGGTLDVIAGNIKRAPKIFQKLGIEWLYRLLKQPWRIGRMMVLPKFGFTVLLNRKKYMNRED